MRRAACLLLTACATTGAPPATLDVWVDNQRVVPVRVRAEPSALATCDVPAQTARRCAVALATQPPVVLLTLRPVDGGRPDTITVTLRDRLPVRLRLPWAGAAFVSPDPR